MVVRRIGAAGGLGLLAGFLVAAAHGASTPARGTAGSGSGASPAFHDDEARFVRPLSWEEENVSAVYGLKRSELGVVLADDEPVVAETSTISGRSCAVAGVLGIDVDDDFAFDVDEPVRLELTVATAETTSSPIRVAWDRNGGEGRGSAEVRADGRGDPFRTVGLTLDRARMAGQGVRNVDLAVGNFRGRVALCGLRLERSGEPAARPDAGVVELSVTDGGGVRPVPARVGLYDSTGRLPLPSDDALEVHRFADHVRRLWVSPRDAWPSESRQIFYVDGRYRARVPSGRYTLVVTRGPEYRAHRSTVEVPPGGEARTSVALERFADLPAEGWISGDFHIHLPRDEVEEEAVWTQVAAEDVRVGILLQMGNIDGTHFDQPAWGAEGRHARSGHVVVPGQEDPRTGHRGHTIHANLRGPIHPERGSYFLYHRVFDASRSQGGVSGYAHLAPWFNPRRGLALDVPFGLVDFVEVLQYGRLDTDIWYDFLDLGYRLVPAAGSDYPYLDLPGAVRQYVRVEGDAGAEAWFEAFREGRTYVTSGPFLKLSVDGAGMGAQLDVEAGARVPVVAEARLNPDVDALDRLELVVAGEVVATERARGRSRVELRTEVAVEESAWLAVRAYGGRESRRRTVVAHSAPVYLVVDGRPTWTRDAVPDLVRRYQGELDEMMSEPLDPDEDLEPWETREILPVEWERQRELLQDRVEHARARLGERLERAQREASR